ncbi:hypothetical protein RBI22_23175 [Alcaligenaceae bacterium C4P045]|nr:hypothetical protein [Alcaligenaceae bacterium C4P045]
MRSLFEQRLAAVDQTQSLQALQLPRDNARKAGQRDSIDLVELSGSMANQAKRTHRGAVVQNQRRASIELDVRFAGDKGIVSKARIDARIVYHQRLALGHGDIAKRVFTWNFKGDHARCRVGVLHIAAQQCHACGRDTKVGTCQIAHILQPWIAGRRQIEVEQKFQPGGLVVDLGKQLGSEHERGKGYSIRQGGR